MSRASSGYVQLPEGWERVASDGPGRFVTSEVYRRPDGTEVRWRSRGHRKGAAVRYEAPSRSPGTGQRVWWRPRSRGWWMAVLFALGSSCFVAGGVASQWASTSRPAIGVTF